MASRVGTILACIRLSGRSNEGAGRQFLASIGRITKKIVYLAPTQSTNIQDMISEFRNKAKRGRGAGIDGILEDILPPNGDTTTQYYFGAFSKDWFVGQGDM